MNEVLQGDCLELMKGMPDGSVDMILTDPPYGMNYQSNRRTSTPKFKKIKGDTEVSWYKAFIRECYRVLKSDSHAYVFCNEYNVSHFRKMQEDAGFNNKRTLIWLKNNHTSGDLLGDYGNKTEYINFMHKGRRLLNGKRNNNVLEFKRVQSSVHPTEKPIDLLEFLIEKSTTEGDVILDPFAGSGTTGVACQNLNRNFILMEQEPEYVEIIKERLKASKGER